MPGDIPHSHSCVTSFVLPQSLLGKDPGEKLPHILFLTYNGPHIKKGGLRVLEGLEICKPGLPYSLTG